MVVATGADQIQVSFTHMPRWPQSLIGEMEDRGEHQPHNLAEIGMVTVVRDSNKNEVMRFVSDQDVSISIAKLLELAGGYSLDDHHLDFSAANGLLNDVNADKTTLAYRQQLKTYPHMRITGTKLTISISYYNSASRGHAADTIAPICYIDVVLTPQWSGRPVVEYMKSNEAGEDEYRSRYYTGVLVEFTVSGSYSYVAYMKILNWLANLLVYLTLPNIIMTLITKFCLGTLSEMYNAAQMQLLDSWQLFSGQVCRAIVGMFAYNRLVQLHQGQELGETPAGAADQPADTQLCKQGLPRLKGQVLRKQLQDLFGEFKDLDLNEIDVLVTVLLRILDKDGDKHITKIAWVETFVNSDVSTLKNWAALFDSDRKACCLEKVFDTGAKVRKKYARISMQERELDGEEAGLADGSAAPQVAPKDEAVDVPVLRNEALEEETAGQPDTGGDDKADQQATFVDKDGQTCV